MAVTTTNNKPLNPRGNDQSPKGYNRAELYSGKALDFDGVNDKIDVSFAFSGNTTSISFYLNWDSYGTSNVQFICESQTGSTFMVHLGGGAGTNGIRLSMSGTTFDSPNAILSGYNHYTLTTDNTTASLYVNGKLFNSESVSLGSAVTTSLAIAYRSAGNILFLNGKLSGFKIFNTALTAAQVADLYNNPEKIVPTGVADSALKLWLPMQEGAGTTCYDGSGNGNHGTISGATWTHGIGAPVAQTAVISWNKGTNNIGDHAWDASAVSNNSSISTSSHSAPNGVETAFIFDDGTANTYHRSYKQASCSAGEVTASVFVKKKDVDYINVVLGVDGGGSKDFALVDLVNGTINDTSGNPTDTSIQSVGDGWYYVSVQETHASGNAIIYIYGQDPTNGSSIDDSYTGANNQTYIWGASVKDGPINNVFVPTYGSVQTTEVLLPQGLTTGRDITGVNLFENVRKQGALNLDGNSWAEVHDNASLDLTSTLTIEAWVYWDLNGASAGGIMGKWFPSNWGFLFFTNAATLTFYISNVYPTTASVSHTFTANGWYHLVGTDDGTNIRLYIDGVQVGTTSSLGSIVDTGRELEIGRYNDSINNTYQDSIAQPRIYNRALTAEEVERNYNAGKNIYK